AALCHSYDHLVHHANNLASKHPRFSLLHPSSSKQAPLCDICQGNPLRDCDVPIHSANQHAQKRNRFLLTGVKLSETSSFYTSYSASLSNGGDSVAAEFKSQPWVKNLAHFNSPSLAMEINKSNGDKVLGSEGVSSSMSSISEHLIETHPSWHVEDFHYSSSPPSAFTKTDDAMLPCLDSDVAIQIVFHQQDIMGMTTDKRWSESDDALQFHRSALLSETCRPL
ncbi:hypothetical protein Gorai_022784, partial [Gossypium raimondii]|nr:hypothetical protein [Gossypium raimondii]